MRRPTVLRCGLFPTRHSDSSKRWWCAGGRWWKLRATERARKDLAADSVRPSIEAQLEHLSQQIAELDGQLPGLLKQNPSWHKHDELPHSVEGVGDVTSAMVVALLPDLGPINRKRISELAGVAPPNCDSGRKQGKRQLWVGRAAVRAGLYMATLAANQQISAHFQRLRQAGKPFKVALVAYVRKLLCILNTMLRDGHPYIPTLAAES